MVHLRSALGMLIGANVRNGPAIVLARLRRSLQNFLAIEIGTGIICHDEVYRGANGSAGDVGYICVDGAGPRSHCSRLGCVEAMAAGPAISRMAHEAAASGESEALAVCLQTNGGITRVGPLFLTSVRQSVYHRSLALSARHLDIQYTPLGNQASLAGADVLALQQTLAEVGGRHER